MEYKLIDTEDELLRVKKESEIRKKKFLESQEQLSNAANEMENF